MATPNSKLSGELSFAHSNVALGGDTSLHLRLKSSTKLADQLGQEGTIFLTFTSDTDPDHSYEYDYGYEFNRTTSQLRRFASTSNENGPLFGHYQVDFKDVTINGQTVDLIWYFNNWKQSAAYRVSGSILVKGTGATAEFKATTLTVAAPVTTTPSPAPVITTPTTAPAGRLPIPLPVTLYQAQREESFDQLLWGVIRRRSVNFSRYRNFIDRVLCTTDTRGDKAREYLKNRQVPFNRLASYALLKHATEFYLMQEAGVAIDSEDPDADTVFDPADELHRTGGIPFDINELREQYLVKLRDEEGKVLPYFNVISEKLSEVPLKDPKDLLGGLCYGILKSKLQAPPLLELIWSYWHEEGGLVQTMNALSLRFQNVRRPGPGPDPLANLAIDPLRPLNNIIWGYIEDERNRLTMNRRNLEYQYEYGFGLIGRGVQNIAVAENRAFFLRGFHSLLRAATEFYQQANFTTVIPDGFPILNHLREVHLTLAEGAHNQYGDLPWTARVEMLTQQWILARPEVREFLGGRVMVPYTEPWMDRVDNMKSLQGWTPTNITHFRDLGAFGEQLLLSIRYGSWNSPTVGATNAANWAHYWREEIQRYIHAYKAVTGIDLATDLGDIRQNAPDNEERFLQPAELIERQNAIQQGQLRRNRQLNTGMGPLRQPAFGLVPRRRALNE